ncbi:MAG: indole-3-glycerol phosphate synthase TrpC [bacterium]|nr:indole-3-glycerol phosphate synthase TrpC [bacterium]
MHNFLVKIINNKKTEIQEIKNRYGLEKLKKQALAIKHDLNNIFYDALSSNQLSIISEIKKASPSKGVIREDFNPVELAKEFKKKNSSALSVLTEKAFFQGSPDFIPEIKKQVNLPVLRKDFLIDPVQIYESKIIKADAVLLIKALLSEQQCQELIDTAESVNLDILLEIHTVAELNEIKNLSGRFLVGINNRDLHTFHTDTNNAINIFKKAKSAFPDKTLFVAESGYSNINQLKEINELGFNAVLIGEGLAKKPEILDFFRPAD